MKRVLTFALFAVLVWLPVAQQAAEEVVGKLNGG